MNGTVDPPSSSSTAAFTCRSRTPSSSAILPSMDVVTVLPTRLLLLAVLVGPRARRWDGPGVTRPALCRVAGRRVARPPQGAVAGFRRSAGRAGRERARRPRRGEEAAPSSVSRATPGPPRCSYGARSIRSVASSSPLRSSVPSSVSSPSAVSSPRSRSRSDAASQSARRQPREDSSQPIAMPLPVAVWLTRASSGSSSAARSAARWASPRCSRSSVAACQYARCGSSGTGRPACAAYSGRACRVQPSVARRASCAASAISGGDDLLAEQPAQRRVGGAQPGVQDLRGGGYVPDRGNVPGHQRVVEVVEGRGHRVGADRAHRGGAGGEVDGGGVVDADPAELLAEVGEK